MKRRFASPPGTVIPAAGQLQALSDRLTPAIATVLLEWLGYQLAGSLLAILPTALLMGVAFPIGPSCGLAGRQRPRGTVGGRLGLSYSLNVVAPSSVRCSSGFVLLPATRRRTSPGRPGLDGFVSGLLLLARFGGPPAPSRVAAAAAAVHFRFGGLSCRADPFTNS